MKRNMDVVWSYEGADGPEHWHELCDWFGYGALYPYQSPIALNQEDSVSEVDYQAPVFHYQTEGFTDKEFKNTIHYLPYDASSYLEFQGDKFYLTDIHFHKPSEHFLNHEQLPLECHLVHMNSQHENLVCGVFLTFDKEGLFSKATGATWDYLLHDHHFNPSIFLPEKRSHFHYVGSLTTPPTSGPIHWLVFDSVVTIEPAFAERFNEEIAKNNFRPLQDRKGRKINYYQ